MGKEMNKVDKMLDLISKFIDDPENSMEEREGWQSVYDEIAAVREDELIKQLED